MTMDDLLDMLTETLGGDQDLQTWATAFYGRTHTVYKGIDERNPPAEDQYPALHLFPRDRSGSLTPGGDRFAVGLVIGLLDESGYQATGGHPNTSALPGIAGLDNAVDLVIAAIRGTNTDDLFLESVDVAYETVEFYPFYLAELTIGFTTTMEYPG